MAGEYHHQNHIHVWRYKQRNKLVTQLKQRPYRAHRPSELCLCHATTKLYNVHIDMGKGLSETHP